MQLRGHGKFNIQGSDMGNLTFKVVGKWELRRYNWLWSRNVRNGFGIVGCIGIMVSVILPLRFQAKITCLST
jgi:hypothetical protein